MPTITILFGVQIYINQLGKEHGVPHIHARYGDYKAAFAINDGSTLAGNLPTKQRKIVERFIEEYKDELLKMWNEETKCTKIK